MVWPLSFYIFSISGSLVPSEAAGGNKKRLSPPSVSILDFIKNFVPGMPFGVDLVLGIETRVWKRGEVKAVV